MPVHPSKATLARILALVAFLTSGWAWLAGSVAPFGAVGPAAFVVPAAGGIASLAALIFAARRPRQAVIIAIAGMLTLAHFTMWLWIAVISFGGGI